MLPFTWTYTKFWLGKSQCQIQIGFNPWKTHGIQSFSLILGLVYKLPCYLMLKGALKTILLVNLLEENCFFSFFLFLRNFPSSTSQPFWNAHKWGHFLTFFNMVGVSKVNWKFDIFWQNYMQIDVKYNNKFPHQIVRILFILVKLSHCNVTIHD